MSFTDDDLKRLKERLGAMRPFHEMKPHMTPVELEALLAQLEAAEVLVQQLKDGHFPQPWAIEAWNKVAGK